MIRFFKRLFCTLLILALLLAVAAGVFYYTKLDQISYSDGKRPDATAPSQELSQQVFNPDDQVISEDRMEGLETTPTAPKLPEEEIRKADDIQNILLIGTDERSKSFTWDARSDSMILVSINKTKKTVKLVSLERGMGAPVLDGVHKGEWDWLTHIFFYGGADLLMRTVEECFRVEVDRYVRINFNTITSAVDAIGGIEIEMTPAEAGFFCNEIKRPMAVGTNRLDGYEAMMFARLRAIDSDWQRVERQRKVIMAVANELKNADIMELNALADQVLPLVQTNLTKWEITQLLLYAPDFMNSEFDQMTLPKKGTYGIGFGMGGRGYFAADFDVNSQILKDFLYGTEEPAPTEE